MTSIEELENQRQNLMKEYSEISKQIENAKRQKLILEKEKAERMTIKRFEQIFLNYDLNKLKELSSKESDYRLLESFLSETEDSLRQDYIGNRFAINWELLK